MSRYFFAAFFFLLTFGKANSQSLPSSPPMGWNSWDSYGLTINEADVFENAQAMERYLLPSGWRYFVIDEGWYFTNPEARPHPEKLQYALDQYGRFLPAAKRYPSSASGGVARTDGQSLIYDTSLGLAPVGKWLHEHHLLFGIHIIRGIPKEAVRLNLPVAGSAFHAVDVADQQDSCPWDPTSWGVRDNDAGQAWYDSLIQQYAAWGVDFLKVDCVADHPYRGSEIRQIHRAIQKSGRAIVLSLSPGPTSLEHAAEVKDLAQMWRVSNDVWDVWKSSSPFPESVSSQFSRLADWSAYAKGGNWPDADMLPFGELRPRPDVGPGPRESRLTLEEERSQLTLWAFARSPLILGANLTLLDRDTLTLLTNADVIRIDQLAQKSRQTAHEGDLRIWSADLPNNRHAFAFFNVGETPIEVKRDTRELGLPGQYQIRNIWTGVTLPSSKGIALTLQPHSTAAFVTATER